MPTLIEPTAEQAHEVVRDAFHDYPVTRWVLGTEGDYERRAFVLTRFFVMARYLRGAPVFGVEDEGVVAGVALVSPPGELSMPPEFVALREETWAELGQQARARYEEYGAVASAQAVKEPHYHLHILAVRQSHQGRGLSRLLIETVHEASRRHPESAGVDLATERARNVELYEHLGYAVIGHARVGDQIQTWAMFREDDS